MDGLKRYVNDDRFRVDGDKNMRLLAFAFTIVFVWTGPKCNFILNFDFKRFSVLSLKRLVFMMYITMSETFIKTDSLQLLDVSEET